MLKLVLLTTLFLLKTTFVFSEIINNINVIGNNRVSDETIINFSEIKKGNDVSDKTLNESLKNLYKTNFFELVELKLDKNDLTIIVKEYPIIEQIIVNGVKAQKNIKKIKDSMNLKEKNPYIESIVKEDLNRILNTFKQNGFYFVKIDTKIEKIKMIL